MIIYGTTPTLTILYAIFCLVLLVVALEAMEHNAKYLVMSLL